MALVLLLASGAGHAAERCRMLLSNDPSTPALAQDEQLSHIDLAVYLVDEDAACRPHGYANYDAGIASTCETLTRDYIEHTIDAQSQCYFLEQVPPALVDLPPRLERKLYNYSRRASLAPDDRKSLIFVFRWPKRHDRTILLERRQRLVETRVAIQDRHWRSRGGNGLIWLNHQRADALYHERGVEWRLTLGDDPTQTWVFRSWR